MTNLTVDRDFLRVGSKSYAIDKITSLEIRQDRPPSKGPMIGHLIIAVTAALYSIFLPLLLILVVLFLYLAFRARKRLSNRTYRLIAMLSSQEAQTLVTSDMDHAVAMRDAIEAAMANSR